MRKRPEKKLQLNRETLRELDKGDLKEVNAAQLCLTVWRGCVTNNEFGCPSCTC